jgi:hypothetical protein
MLFGSFSAIWGRISGKVVVGSTVRRNCPSLLTNLRIIVFCRIRGSSDDCVVVVRGCVGGASEEYGDEGVYEATAGAGVCTRGVGRHTANRGRVWWEWW